MVDRLNGKMLHLVWISCARKRQTRTLGYWIKVCKIKTFMKYTILGSFETFFKKFAKNMPDAMLCLNLLVRPGKNRDHGFRGVIHGF